jgi:hypothetical protein
MRVTLKGGKTEMLFQGENWDCSEEALKSAKNGSKNRMSFLYLSAFSHS